ncbi:LuxR C-terminal-related transcriptional regulator [Leifsonia shinshuensis]|uniref:helix-turn-helix transcriptional regulator n=1 Tax=Leifsonia shinshuensis TaxID=150026 RepID=UPI002866B16A|nr:LuxR C-terminal-related transcriptional regulator [Leifsonia shinshuensis]MDR6972530.1 non-specific serine/threonine protein kinase [Leifsonia shinshuensis]
MVASSATHHLPARFEPITGRRDETSLVRRLLQGSTRLVTVTGAPGVGKSTVAVAAAASMERSVAGLWYVDLRDRSGEVATAIAHELKADPGADPVGSLIAAIGDDDLLLVLDNADATVAETSALMESLLRSCPALRVIVSSREPLSTRGQSLVALSPFPWERLAASSDAVRLFTECAMREDALFSVDPDTLPFVLRICEATRGVPLAIELAAAQLQFMDVRTLADRMDDQLETLEPADPAARSLRAAVVDSWDRCPPEEQRVWADLSVLAPGWDLDLGEAMAALSAGAGRATRVVKQLLRRSIIHRRRNDDGVRYELLPAIQEFGRAHCADVEAAQVQFVASMIERLQSAEDHWFSDHQGEILRRLRGDVPNIRQAVATAAALGRTDDAITIACTAWRQAWLIHGSVDELGTWLGVALGSGAATPTWGSLGHSLRSWVFAMTEKPGLARGELDAARVAYETVVASGDPRDARACRVALLAAAEPAEPDDAEAVLLLEEAMREQGEEAYRFGRHNVPQRLAARLLAQGRWEEGRRLGDELLERGAAVGDRFERSFVLTTRATAASAAGDYTMSETDAREALQLKRGLGNGLGVAQALELLADVAREKADPVRGATLLGCAAARWREAGAVRANYGPYFYDRATTERDLRLRLGDPAFERAFAYGMELSEDESVDFGLRNVVEARLRTSTPQAAAGAPGLTPREAQVASLVAEGDTNKTIARKLFVSIRTVESHVQNALVKLGLRSRTELAVWYSDHAEYRRAG